MDCTITFTSEVKCIVRGLSMEDRKVLYNRYSFFVPTARFSPLYKLGRWNGKVYYFTEAGTTYVSLLSEIIPYLQKKGYNIKYESYFTRKDLKFEPIDETYLSDLVWYKGHKLEGQPVQLFDHQVEVINELLKNQHGIAQAATGAGKTNISLALARITSNSGKMIIVEPSADLTIQTAEFFNKMGMKAGIVGLGKREFDKLVCGAGQIHGCFS